MENRVRLKCTIIIIEFHGAFVPSLIDKQETKKETTDGTTGSDGQNDASNR